MNKVSLNNLQEILRGTQIDKQKLSLIHLWSQEVESLIQLYKILLKNVASKAQPFAKVNSLYCLFDSLQQPSYIKVNLVEFFFLSHLEQIAQWAVLHDLGGKNSNYFGYKGYKNIFNNLPSLSTNYLMLSLNLIFICSYMKPKKYFRNKQLAASSLFKDIEDKLFQMGYKKSLYHEVAEKLNFVNLKKIYNQSMIDFNKNPHQYIDYFMNELQLAVLDEKNSIDNKDLWFKTLCRNGDAYLSTETLGRLIQILAFHQNFAVKRRCLSLLNELIYWGSLQGLLIVNYTQYIKGIIDRIMKGRTKKGDVNHIIYPEIKGQIKEKQLFEKQLFRFVENIATAFPSLETFLLNSGESPIYQVYVQLKKQEYKFPENIFLTKFEKQIHSNFRLNREYNQRFLQQLDKNKVQSDNSLNTEKPTFQGISNFYQTNAARLARIQTLNDKAEIMSLFRFLKQFTNDFQSLIQKMTDADLISDSKLNDLIEKGLDLKSRINFVDLDFQRYENEKIPVQVFTGMIKQKLDLLNQKASERSEKISSIRSSLKDKIIKNSKNINKRDFCLPNNERVTKFKMNSQLNQIASKRSIDRIDISQLDIFSNPFLGHNLHSKRMLKQFQNPLIGIVKKDNSKQNRRDKIGIKLIQAHKGEKQNPNSGKKIIIEDNNLSDQDQVHANTPKFRSTIDYEMKENQNIGVDSNKSKFFFYVNYLREKQVGKMLQNCQKVIYKGERNGFIGRKKIQYASNSVIVIFVIQNIQNVFYKIESEPSIEIKQMNKTVNSNQITLIGTWLKFGFKIPYIVFYSNQQQLVSTLLPFSFNHFLNIKRPDQAQLSNKQNNKSDQQYKIKINREVINRNQDIALFFNQIWPLNPNRSNHMEIFGGIVQFFKWKCYLEISFSEEKFSISCNNLAYKNYQHSEILKEFLVQFLINLIGSSDKK